MRALLLALALTAVACTEAPFWVDDDVVCVLIWDPAIWDSIIVSPDEPADSIVYMPDGRIVQYVPRGECP